MAKGDNGEFEDKTTIEATASAAGVLNFTINKHLESEAVGKLFVTGPDIDQPINDARINRQRLEPGMLIGIFKLERLLDCERIKFPDPFFVPTPTGAALNKRYTCVIRFMTSDYISCHVLMSKNQTGFAKLPKCEYQNYVSIFPEGADYELSEGVTRALFLTGRKEYEGSMLSLGEYRVHYNEWISTERGSFTTESKIRLKELTLENAYAKNNIDQLLRAANIPQETGETVLALGVPKPCEKFVIDGSLVERATVSPKAKSLKTPNGHETGRLLSRLAAPDSHKTVNSSDRGKAISNSDSGRAALLGMGGMQQLDTTAFGSNVRSNGAENEDSVWRPNNPQLYRNTDTDKNDTTSLYIPANLEKRSYSLSHSSYVDIDTPPRPRKAPKLGTDGKEVHLNYG